MQNISITLLNMKKRRIRMWGMLLTVAMAAVAEEEEAAAVA